MNDSIIKKAINERAGKDKYGQINQFGCTLKNLFPDEQQRKEVLNHILNGNSKYQHCTYFNSNFTYKAISKHPIGL